MTNGKSLTIREETMLDSLKKAVKQSPAEKIKISLKLSNLCFKLSRAAARKK